MNDFSAEDLFEAIDRLVWDLLERHGIEEPPVDVFQLAEEEFDYRIVEIDPSDARSGSAQAGRFGPRPSGNRGLGRRNPNEIAVSPEQSDEARTMIVARACAKALIPRVTHQMRLEPDSRPPRSGHPWVSLIAPRLVLPTRWFRRDVRKAKQDLLGLKEIYFTVPYEILAVRWLDLDEPCLISIVDYDEVVMRRTNMRPVDRKLLPSEERCRATILETEQPARTRIDDWTTHGWPIPDGPFGRIILRSVHDEI